MIPQEKTSNPIEQLQASQVLQEKLEQASNLAQVDETMKAAQAVRLPVSQAITEGIKQAHEKQKKMTGKQRRKAERKARREGSGQWDEVNSIAIACSQMLRVGGGLTPMLAQRELLQHVTDKKLLGRLMDSIVRDTRQLSVDFKKIYSLHKDKDGAIKGDSELMLSYSIFSDYVNFTELTNSCLVPSLAHASEILSEALEKLRLVNPELAAKIDYESINYEFIKATKAMNGITGAGPSSEDSEGPEENQQEHYNAEEATA